MYNRREIGSHYEDIAAEYLEKQGYVILQRNYRAGRHGELDIIAEDPAGLLVICVCRYRRKTGYGDPLESVNMAKQRQICRTTLYYYKEHGSGAVRETYGLLPAAGQTYLLGDPAGAGCIFIGGGI